MKNRVKKLAAMVHIQQDTRIETVVTFICSPDRQFEGNADSWNELVDLINDPASYMKAQQFLWDQDPKAPYVEWELLRPVTMSLRCGSDDDNLARRTACALGVDFELKDLKSEPDSAKGLYSATSQDFGKHIAGTFHVEFATYTNFISVIYYPPLIEMTRELPWNYKDRELCSPKLLFTSGSDDSGSIHVDIDSTPRGRALFFASVAHSADWMFDQFDKLQFKKQKASLQVPSDQSDHSRSVLKTEYNKGGRSFEKPQFARTGLRGDIPRPQIMITNLSDSDSTCPGCLQGNWVMLNGKLIFVASATGVSYKSASMTREFPQKPKPKPKPKPPAKKTK